MILEPADDVVWVDADDEIRLYSAATGDFQTLNASAARIWRMLTSRASVSAVVDDLVTEFASGDPREARMIAADIQEFIGQIQAGGLVKPAAERDGAPADAI